MLVWVFAGRMQHIAIFVCLRVLIWREEGERGEAGAEASEIL